MATINFKQGQGENKNKMRLNVAMRDKKKGEKNAIKRDIMAELRADLQWNQLSLKSLSCRREEKRALVVGRQRTESVEDEERRAPGRRTGIAVSSDRHREIRICFPSVTRGTCARYHLENINVKPQTARPGGRTNKSVFFPPPPPSPLLPPPGTLCVCVFF